MLRFVMRRLLAAIPILLGATLIVFVLLDLTPGNPAESIAGDGASPEDIQRISEALGLNDPLPVRYGRFVVNALQGDLGTSLYSSRTVWEAFTARMPITLGVVIPSLILALTVAVPAGAVAALRQGRLVDRVVTAGAATAMAVPSFVLGIVLVVTFAIGSSLFPATGYVGPSKDVVQWLRHITLPAITLAGVSAAEIARQVRGSMLDVLSQDYIRTARAKGLRRVVITGKHAAKNAAIPVVTVLGLQVTTVAGGAILIERVFAIPGFGSLVIDAVIARDVPMIQGIVVITAVLVLSVNLLVDLSYGYLDPRTRDA